MKLTSLILTTLLLGLGASASELKSDSLRMRICGGMIIEMEEESIYVTGENGIAPQFADQCYRAKPSFIVPPNGIVYNEVLNKAVAMTVKIKFETNENISVLATADLTRSISIDRKTGKILLGGWNILFDEFKIILKSPGIRKVAEQIASRANIHNGDAEVDTFELATFSPEKVLDELKTQEKKRNKERSCKRELLEDTDSVMSVFREAEGSRSPLMSLLKKQGKILTAIGTTSEEWRESCAYHTLYFYLEGGTVLILYYDFTT